MKPSKNLFFLISLGLILIINSCDKDNWEDLSLNQNECENADEQMAQINNEVGIIKKVNLGYDIIYIRISDWGDSEILLKLIPCNLEMELLPVNTKIKISGLIYVNPDEEERYWSENFFNQIVLTEAQIEN